MTKKKKQSAKEDWVTDCGGIRDPEAAAERKFLKEIEAKRAAEEKKKENAEN